MLLQGPGWLNELDRWI